MVIYNRRIATWLSRTLVLLTLTGCAAVNASHESASLVFSESYGTCPMRFVRRANDVCFLTKSGNAVAGTFGTRKKPWGVAYAFNCGSRPKDFYLVVGLPNLDGDLPTTSMLRRGRTDRGFHLELNAYRAVQNLNLVNGWGLLEGIYIKSTCTWHVRAVASGNPRIVARYIPPVPAVGHPGTGRILIGK
jgi:hypothetical protein